MAKALTNNLTCSSFVNLSKRQGYLSTVVFFLCLSAPTHTDVATIHSRIESICLAALQRAADFAYAARTSNIFRKLLKHLNLPIISAVKVSAEASRNVQSEAHMRWVSRTYGGQNIWTRT